MREIYLAPAIVCLLGYAAAAQAQPVSHISAPNVICTEVLGQADQTPPLEQPAEGSGLKHEVTQSGPIVHNWNFKVGHNKSKDIGGVEYEAEAKKGNINLTVNSDGSWNFSGTFPAETGHDVDIVMGLKSSQGSIILFRFAGSIDNGAQFNKTGTSQTLKDNFQAFQDHSWYANYRTPLNSEGIAKKYEARKKKKEQMQEEDRKKEEDKERKEAAKDAVKAYKWRQQQQGGQNNGGGNQNNGGGGDGGGVVGKAISAVGDVTNTLLNGATSAVSGAVQAAGDVASAAVSGVEDVGKAILSIF
jgi:hypothetical protein